MTALPPSSAPCPLPLPRRAPSPPNNKQCTADTRSPASCLSAARLAPLAPRRRSRHNPGSKHTSTPPISLVARHHRRHCHHRAQALCAYHQTLAFAQMHQHEARRAPKWADRALFAVALHLASDPWWQGQGLERAPPRQPTARVRLCQALQCRRVPRPPQQCTSGAHHQSWATTRQLRRRCPGAPSQTRAHSMRPQGAGSGRPSPVPEPATLRRKPTPGLSMCGQRLLHLALAQTRATLNFPQTREP
jgi:hypothetical protein